MLEVSDFLAKQIVVAFCVDGDKIKIQNDNVLIITADGEVKCQVTCYRLFSIFIIGSTTLTTVLIERAKKFGFTIVLFSPSFRVNEVIGFRREANTILHKKQYDYQGLDIAKYIVSNKIENQLAAISKKRNKSFEYKGVSKRFKDFQQSIKDANSIQEIMGFEGMASKLYFYYHFYENNWKGRKPRVKNDYINSILDIGYTVLFAFIEALLSIYGFDIYVGVLHTMFYMRESLVCDIMEPFRVIVDEQVKKSINLNQFKENDFIVKNNRYELSWDKSKKYVAIILGAILERREEIFVYVRQYYRAFMKDKTIEEYPKFEF